LPFQFPEPETSAVNTFAAELRVPDHGGAGRQFRVVLDRHRVYIFPTRHGWYFVLALAVMLLGSINYGNSLAFVLTFLLSGVGLVGILHTYRNLAGLRYSGGRAEPTFAGKRAHFTLFFDNRGQHGRTSIRIERYPRRTGSRWLWRRRRPPSRCLIIDIDADALCSAGLTLEAERRGLFNLGRIRLETTYPLGLLRAWSFIETAVQCVVYPKPLGRPELPPATPAAQRDLGGRMHGTDDFVGFRAYHAGDSPRYIAWKAYARSDELIVKRFTGSGAVALTLHWDQTAHLGSVESRLSQLCLWVLEAETRGFNYGLSLPQASVARGLGDEHRHRCLSSLALHGIE